MTNQPTIGLLGVTGRVGRATLEALRPSAMPIRCLVRRRGIDLGPGCEVVEANATDPEAMVRALKGVQRLFLVMADGPKQTEIEIGIIEAAKRAGVTHIVKGSAITASLTPPNSFGLWHRPVEEHLQNSGLAWTILRPTFFFQTLEMFLTPMRKFGWFPLACGDGRMAMVDAHDLGAAAARCLSEPGHDHKIYTLTGPEAFSAPEIAYALSAAVGKSIRRISLPHWLSRLMMVKGDGLDPEIARRVSELCDVVRTGGEATVHPDLEILLGRPRRTFAQYLPVFNRVFAHT